MDLKAISFVLLVLQNTLGTIVIKYSRATTKYHGTTTVMLYEILKLVIVLAIILAIKRGNISATIKAIRIEVLGDTQGFLKMIMLAALYSFQNNVQLVALDYVSASTYSIVYQLKIVTTAFFMMIFLKRSFHIVQWIAMFVLMLGVVICSSGSQSSASANGKSSSVFGILIVVGLAVNSGIAAAYFERVLKTHEPNKLAHDHVPMDPMWKSNVQLAAVSVVVASFGVCHTAATTPNFSFFEGYNKFTWGVIWLQACGGLIVSAVVRYSDNVVKNFGTAFSLVLGCILSNYLFDDQLTPLFFVGVFLVVMSVYVYGDSRLHSKPKQLTLKDQVNVEQKEDVVLEPLEHVREDEPFLNQRVHAKGG